MKFSIALTFVAAVSASQYYEEGPNESVVAPVSSAAEEIYSEVVPTTIATEIIATSVASEVVPEEPTQVISYTTEIVESYTTYCPEPTTITDGTNVITVTEPTIITITHCPGGCTVEVPCTTTSAVVCEDDCAEPTAEEPVFPPTNGTATFRPTNGSPEPTGAPPSDGDDEPIQSGAAKMVGVGLAAFVGLVAFL